MWGFSRSTTYSETDGCYWNCPGNTQQQRSNGNIYSPNPEDPAVNRTTENDQENVDEETNQESRLVTDTNLDFYYNLNFEIVFEKLSFILDSYTRF